MTATTKASAAAVSRCLKAAGIPKSEYHRSKQVKGWGESTRGFEASNDMSPNGTKTVHRRVGGQYVSREVTNYTPSGTVYVVWRRGSWARLSGSSVKDESTELAKCADVLKAAGYEVAQDTVGAIGSPRLIVTRPTS